MKGKLLILLLVGVLSFCVKTLQGFAYSDELSKYFALKLVLLYRIAMRMLLKMFTLRQVDSKILILVLTLSL